MLGSTTHVSSVPHPCSRLCLFWSLFYYEDFRLRHLSLLLEGGRPLTLKLMQGILDAPVVSPTSFSSCGLVLWAETDRNSTELGTEAGVLRNQHGVLPAFYPSSLAQIVPQCKCWASLIWFWWFKWCYFYSQGPWNESQLRNLRAAHVLSSKESSVVLLCGDLFQLVERKYMNTTEYKSRDLLINLRDIM